VNDERVFILRSVNDNSGSVCIEAYRDLAEAEKEAQEIMEGMTSEKTLDPWTRGEDDEAVCWNPPESIDTSPYECVVWKTPLDGPVVAGEPIYAIWVMDDCNEMGVREAYTTKAAAEAAAERAMDRIGGDFHMGGDTDGVTFMTDDGDKEVFIWHLIVLGSVHDPREVADDHPTHYEE
jgi:hypothetical protein